MKIKITNTLLVITVLLASCKKEGCTDIGASNYDEKAKKDDGSCEYLPIYGTVTDIDGNIYKTVKIGGQEWMVENLKVTHYRNGDAIPVLTDEQDWNDAGDNSIGAYCSYENSSSNADVYGCLYNWHAVNDARKLAPQGWHIPTNDELIALETFLNEETQDVGGGKLKENGVLHWQSPNKGATNQTGFTALPGGKRDNNYGAFDQLGTLGYWWTSTETGSSNGSGKYFYLSYNF